MEDKLIKNNTPTNDVTVHCLLHTPPQSKANIPILQIRQQRQMTIQVVIATKWPNISFGFQLRDVCQVPGAFLNMVMLKFIHS